MLKKLFIMIVMMIVSCSASAFALDINIAFEDKEQPPYYMGNSKNVLPDNPGIAVEMVLLLGKMVDDVNIKLQRMPWKRCTHMLGENKIDGIFNASYKKSRLDLGWYPTKDGTHGGEVDPSRRITTIAYSLYAQKSSNLQWTGSNYDILKGSVGAPLGYSIVGDLKKMGVKVEEAPTTEINLRKLKGNRLVAVALQDVTADVMIQSMPKEFGGIVKLEPPIKTKPYYLMLSKKFVSAHPELAQKIWDAMKLIRETKFDEIAAKY